jgi:hypothetical protein
MNDEFSPGKAMLWSVAAAAALLVVVVLPAEYGIDWTGAGRVLGLTTMGKQKVAAAKAAAAPAAVAAANGSSAPAPVQYATSAGRALRNDSVDVTLPPKGEVEYKAVLAEGDVIVYEWDAAGASLTFDFHGEPDAGPQGAFLSFEKGSAAKGTGTLRAPFAGTHGWYWRNQTAATVVIRLKVSGFHTDMKRM